MLATVIPIIITGRSRRSVCFVYFALAGCEASREIIISTQGFHNKREYNRLTSSCGVLKQLRVYRAGRQVDIAHRRASDEDVLDGALPKS